MLRPLAHPVARCWMLLKCCCEKFETGQTFQPTTATFLLFRDRWSVARQCVIRLHSSSNIVGAMHAHCACFTKTYGLYPSHDAVPTLLAVVASVCTPLPTRTQQLRTLLAQQCWELLRPFARSLKMTDTVIAFLLLQLLVLRRACNIDLVPARWYGIFSMQIQATRPDEKDLVPISATTKEN